jgi:hypothetical protein
MDCDSARKILYENPVGDHPVILQDHLRSCSDCEREYLKISKLDLLFKTHALKVKQIFYAPMRVSFGLSLCAVALVFFWISSPKVLLEGGGEETVFSLAARVSSDLIVEQGFSTLEAGDIGRGFGENPDFFWSPVDEISVLLEESAEQAFDLSYCNRSLGFGGEACLGPHGETGINGVDDFWN